jgi:hypothetical protein
MILTRPNGGMFGIKLVGDGYQAWRFHNREGTPPLMNFPDGRAGRRIAASIPIGHRSLVYLMHPTKRLCAAIEYVSDPKTVDVLKQGKQAAIAQNAVAQIEAYGYPHFSKIWRCVRIVAWIDDPNNAPTPDFEFHQGDVMFDIDENEYLNLFTEIPWTWKA